MNTELITHLADSSKLSYQNLQELNAINTRIFSKFAELQFNVAKLGLESSIEQAKLLTGISVYEDLMSAESDFANTCRDNMMKISRELGDVLVESHGEFAGWLAKQFAEGKQKAGKQVKAKPATKRATTKKAA